MKCIKWVKWVRTSRPPLKPIAWGDSRDTVPDIQTRHKGERVGPELCRGDIVAVVSLQSEPYYGGCETVLDIEYRCAKCGWIYNFNESFPNDADELSKWLTNYIASL